MHPDIPWSYRPIFSFLAGEDPDGIFSLAASRAEILRAQAPEERIDATSFPDSACLPTTRCARTTSPAASWNRMYPGYEPRAEQVEMACEVRDALATGTHRVIEAGTGVGKSVAYLVPFAEAARRNNVTVGIATKSNNLADQLIYHELPRLAREMDDGLTFCALKGYDHYPCLRKLERLSRSDAEIQTSVIPQTR